MTALLRKDLYITGRQLRLLFIVALGLAFTPQFHAVGTIYLLALSMTLSQGSTEQAAEVDTLAGHISAVSDSVHKIAKGAQEASLISQ